MGSRIHKFEIVVLLLHGVIFSEEGSAVSNHFAQSCQHFIFSAMTNVYGLLLWETV